MSQTGWVVYLPDGKTHYYRQGQSACKNMVQMGGRGKVVRKPKNPCIACEVALWKERRK